MTTQFIEFDGGDESKNIYQKLKPEQLDNQLIKHNKFVLRQHQTVPKYYLLNHEDRLILHYSMGSGKTSAAIFIATHFLDIRKINRFLSVYNNVRPVNRKSVYVIGPWQTYNAFLNDIIRPEFHFTTVDEMNDINKKLTSSFKEIREEGEEQKQRMIKQLNKMMIFKNYQGFFNECFPNIDEKKYSQNIQSLMDSYENGLLKIDRSFLESLEGSLIVVDEMQRMYSTDGLNTYGFTLAVLMKSIKHYNIKIIFLTGTMINNSLYEVPEIMSIMNQDKFEKASEYLEQSTILNDVKIFRLKRSMEDSVEKFFSNIFLFYDQSVVEGGVKEYFVKSYKNEISGRFKLPGDEYDTVNSIQALKQLYCLSSDYILPHEIHVGNILLSDDEQKMNLYCVTTSGYQAEKYLKYIAEHQTMSRLGEEEESVSIHDGIFDSKDQSIRYEKNKGVYAGEGLKYPNIKKYSAIGSEMVRIAIYTAVQGEKMIIYHDKIAGFGLKQYIEILSQNGFISFGTSPRNDTRCNKCGVEFKNHSSNHAFVPMRYAALYGELSDKERVALTKVYNSPNNLYGDYISVMFISSVAYAGVSFFNTNHIMILNKINNLSKWKQIYSRIIRSHSHDLLPKEKRFANVYTMIIQYPNEKKITGTNLLFEEKYYKIRNILNGDVSRFTNRLSETSITNKLFKTPELLGEEYNTKAEIGMFNDDVQKEINIIFNNLNLTDRIPWSINAVMKRIQDPNNSLSFMDMSRVDKKDLLGIIVEKRLLKFFKYNGVDNNLFCIPNTDVQTIEENVMPKFYFTDLSYLSVESKNVKNILSDLSLNIDRYDAIAIRNLLTKLFRFINNNFSKIIFNPIFWNAIYKIHDEYYADDSKNFVVNHSSKGRSETKVAGFYHNNTVVLKDGNQIKISKIISSVKVLTDVPYAFKLSPISYTETLLWFLRLIIITPNDVMDKRKKNKGISCISFDIEKLAPYFPNIDRTIKRKNYCISLMEEVCNKAISNNEVSNISTPFY